MSLYQGLIGVCIRGYIQGPQAASQRTNICSTGQLSTRDPHRIPCPIAMCIHASLFGATVDAPKEQSKKQSSWGRSGILECCGHRHLGSRVYCKKHVPANAQHITSFVLNCAVGADIVNFLNNPRACHERTLQSPRNYLE